MGEQTAGNAHNLRAQLQAEITSAEAVDVHKKLCTLHRETGNYRVALNHLDKAMDATHTMPTEVREKKRPEIFGQLAFTHALIENKVVANYLATKSPPWLSALVHAMTTAEPHSPDLQEALPLFPQRGELFCQAIVLLSRSGSSYAEEVRKNLTDLLQVMPKGSYSELLLQTTVSLRFYRQGHTDKAISLYQQIAASANKYGYIPVEAHCREQLGVVYGKLGLEASAQYLASALSLYKRLGLFPSVVRCTSLLQNFGRRVTDAGELKSDTALMHSLLDVHKDHQSQMLAMLETKTNNIASHTTAQPPSGPSRFLDISDSLIRVVREKENVVAALQGSLREERRVAIACDYAQQLARTTEISTVADTLLTTIQKLFPQCPSFLCWTNGQPQKPQRGNRDSTGLDIAAAYKMTKADCLIRMREIYAMTTVGNDNQDVANSNQVKHQTIQLEALRDEEGLSIRLGKEMQASIRRDGKTVGLVYIAQTPDGRRFTQTDHKAIDILCEITSATVTSHYHLAEASHQTSTKAAVFEALSEGIIAVDTNLRITSANASALRFLQRQELQLLQDVPCLSFVANELAHRVESNGRLVKTPNGEVIANTRLVTVPPPSSTEPHDHNSQTNHDNKKERRGEVLGIVVTLTEFKTATSVAHKLVGGTARYNFSHVVGASLVIRKAIDLARAATQSDSSVLITGESGTGKEIIAQAIHNDGKNSSGPFIAVNCAAIPRELIESELFGYESGSFTGADHKGRPGKFELAENGTLLLDEIGDMPLEMQAKLLRVLQERRCTRVGGNKEIALGCRIIATTNRDLQQDAVAGRFRQDLFYRLRVIHIHLPPLRERKEDIPVLCEHYLKSYNEMLGKQMTMMEPKVIRAFLQYGWPGNVRELQHLIEGEVNLAKQDTRTLSTIPIQLANTNQHYQDTPLSVPGSLCDSERVLLAAALKAHGGKIPAVARSLGVSRGTVYNKMRKFGIDPEEFRQ